MFHEELLQYTWQHQFFNRKDLRTTSGEKLEIIKAGFLNSHSGPDFFNGQIRIASILWVGNIEVHLKSSDWYRHHHQNDRAYSKVILHVVWEHDREVFDLNGHVIPVLELKGRVQKRMILKYDELRSQEYWIPCAKFIHGVELIHVRQMFDRMAMERLEEKSSKVERLLDLHKGNWESTLYQMLARQFGFRTNAIPFELVAIQTPFQLIHRYASEEKKLMAMIFGQAGMLEARAADQFQEELQHIYFHLKRLHGLQAIDRSIWKFFRLRPANFPTIRLAQFISLYARHKKLFDLICRNRDLQEVYKIFQQDIEPYWHSHSKFGETSRSRFGKIGKSSVDVIIINVVIPLLFCWFRKRGEDRSNELLDLLQMLKAEKNNYTSQWSELGINIDSALESQACVQLKQHYCALKKCLNCTIGNAVLKPTYDRSNTSIF